MMVETTHDCRQNNLFMDTVEQIRNHLLYSPKLAGGSQVVESAIAKQLNCSRSPVREAIKYLASLGLLEIIPNRGAFIVELSSSEVKEIFELRLLVESALLEKIVMEDMLDAEGFARLEGHFAAMVHAAKHVEDKHESIKTIVEHDLKFHQVLWNAAQRPYYSNVLVGLHTKLTISMYKDYYMRTPHLLDDVMMHEDIIVCLRKGHVAKLIQALSEHVGIYYTK